MLALVEVPVTVFSRTEEGVVAAVLWLKLAVEVVGALIIGLGILTAGGLLVKALLARRTADFTAIRLTLARYLALALEFQLEADILSTAIAPSRLASLGPLPLSARPSTIFYPKKCRKKSRTTARKRPSWPTPVRNAIFH